MENLGLITFISDFGWRGGYVAACEAVVLSVAPAVRVLHVGHEVPLGDLNDAARCLARVAPLGPVAVHLAVVDPGVGTGRRPLALAAARGDLLVGPDNGLLVPAAAALGGVDQAWMLDATRVRRTAGLQVEALSHTFHGRDLFAPAAALLAAGVAPSAIADPIATDALVSLPDPIAIVDDDLLRVEVIEVDRFGNVALCVDLETLSLDRRGVTVCADGDPDARWMARPVFTFGDLAPGELGLLQDSWGYASLALNGASAAELLGARVGGSVEIRHVDPAAPEVTARAHPQSNPGANL